MINIKVPMRNSNFKRPLTGERRGNLVKRKLNTYIIHKSLGERESATENRSDRWGRDEEACVVCN